MRVRVHQLNPTIGNIDGNVSLIRSAYKDAVISGIDLLVLPEMVLTGYPAQDLLEKEAFRTYCYRMNSELTIQSGKTALLFGTVTPNTSRPGRKMFNSALLVQNGELKGQTNKTLLPTYDVFDDLRYFEPNALFGCLELDGLKLGVTICEDIWYNENEVQYHHYEVNPARKMKDLGADILINISASPFTKTKQENRSRMLRSHATSLHLPLLYCNQVGAQTDIIFDGDSQALDAQGEVVATAGLFQAGYFDVEWQPGLTEISDDKNRTPAEGKTGIVQSTGLHQLEDAEKPKAVTSVSRGKEALLFEAIQTGLRDYLVKTKISRDVVLGLSGGIDSAIVAALAAATIGGDHVTALTMPSDFSSGGSVQDSRQLADNLGMSLHEISIAELYNDYLLSLEPLFRGSSFGVAEENLQSRIRGTMLMAYSNKHGHMLLSTGNKSELSVGYATLYGDMNGGLNLIGDLYKTEVYSLARWLNESYFGKEVIPVSIIEKAPSAELRPDQKDTDSLPPYEILDEILLRYIDLQQESADIVNAGFSEETVRQTIRMVDRNEFKRYQSPPILKLSSKSYGIGRRWPLVQGWTGHEFK